MARYAADLHIHSCLSPCGDEDMTPNNIVGMAAIKELEMIAVADHNTALNLPAVATVCERFGMVHIPALEVQTVEDVHVLCYLPTVDAALDLGALVYDNLPPLPNNADIFGPQVIRDEADAETGQLEKLLLQGTALDLGELDEAVRKRDGVCVPAHINREANSILYVLGFMPALPQYTAVEIGRMARVPDMDLSPYHILYSSDAHYLEDIFERDNFIGLEEPTPKALIEKLRTPKEG
ncbi:hypothetical protein LJC20_00930 [Eubacteriales bacterium OttesenSCG-928-M02]|nr:hypothetical protein [Eubacteriales bacterium OttesenSCG-928-M02]